jgi:hypothetical protein
MVLLVRFYFRGAHFSVYGCFGDELGATEIFKKHLAEGHPLVVASKMNLNLKQLGHAQVVAGNLPRARQKRLRRLTEEKKEKGRYSGLGGEEGREGEGASI